MTRIIAALTLGCAISLWGCASASVPDADQDSLAWELLCRLDAAPISGRKAVYEEMREKKLPQVLPALIARGLEPGLGLQLASPSDVVFLPLRDLVGSGERELYQSLLDVSPELSGVTPDDVKQRGDVIYADIRLDRLKSWLDHENLVVRYLAVSLLYRNRIPSCAAGIKARIDDAPVDRHPWLAPLCAVIRPSYGREAISTGLTNGETWAVACAAASRDQSTVALLTQALRKRAYPHPEDLVWALGELRSADALPELLAQISGGGDQVSADAAEALVKIHDPSVVPQLAKVLLGTSRPYVQAALLDALGELGSKQDLPVLNGYAISPSTNGVINIAGCAQRAIEKIQARGR